MHRLNQPLGFQITENTDNPKAHDIFMYGIIGWEINVDKLWAELSDLPTSVEELNFFVHSEGGFVYEGYALLSNLDRLKSKYLTRGYIDGIAASMASAFVVRMDETIASPTSKMIIHDPWMWLDIFGGYNSAELTKLMEDLENMRGDLDTDSEIMAQVYADKTGLSKEEVRERWMSDGKDHSFTPAQMLDNGLIDSIATQEFKKPPELEEVEDDDWLSNMLINGRAAAMEKDAKHLLYRGQYEKSFARFALNSKSEYNKNGNTSTDTDGKPQNKPATQMSKFASIASKLGLDPSVDEATILNKVEKMQGKITRLEKETNDQQGLIDTYTETQEQNEARIEELETELRNSKTGSVVQSVIEEVTKKAEGQKVNKNVVDEMTAIAADYLKAKAEGNEKQTKNYMQHMQLLAKTNLIPIGSDANLDDDETSRSDKPDGDVDVEKLKEARKRGEEAKKKMQARHKKAVHA